LMIAVWQRLPVWVTRIIGPPIVANIPWYFLRAFTYF
jgi:hypothetical protein